MQNLNDNSARYVHLRAPLMAVAIAALRETRQDTHLQLPELKRDRGGKVIKADRFTITVTRNGKPLHDRKERAEVEQHIAALVERQNSLQTTQLVAKGMTVSIAKEQPAKEQKAAEPPKEAPKAKVNVKVVAKAASKTKGKGR